MVDGSAVAARTYISSKDDIDSLADTGSANPQLAPCYNIDVREFVVLASLFEAGTFDVERVAARVKLSLSTAQHCIDCLVDNGLAYVVDESHGSYAVSSDGRAVVRESQRIEHAQSKDPTQAGISLEQ